MIIGSSAIKHYFPDFNRVPKDLDILYSEEKDLNLLMKYKSDIIVEKLYNPIFKDYNIGLFDYIPVNLLYTLKISHCLWDIAWEKHIYDIQFLKEKDAEADTPLLYSLFSYWEKLRGKRKDSFEKTLDKDRDLSTKGFFQENETHDKLHEILIQHSYFKEKIPTYKKILINEDEVDVSMYKFGNLSYKEKFNVVFEEVAVMQYERFPHLYYKKGFEKMLKKFTLEHCKFREAIFIIENHKELVTQIPFNFIEYLNNNKNDI